MVAPWHPPPHFHLVLFSLALLLSQAAMAHGAELGSVSPAGDGGHAIEVATPHAAAEEAEISWQLSAALALSAARAQMDMAPPPPKENPLQAHDGHLVLGLFEGAWRLYKVALSPHTGATCAFHPSCSRFGLDAVKALGPVRGVLLTLDRLQRDHPYAYRFHTYDNASGLLIDPIDTWCAAAGGRCP